AAVGGGESLHRNDRGRMQLGGRPHFQSGYCKRARKLGASPRGPLLKYGEAIPSLARFQSDRLIASANLSVRSASARRPSSPSISVGQLSVRTDSGPGSGSPESQIMASIRPS